MTHPIVQPFFEPRSETWSYVVFDPVARQAAVIDSVMDFDGAAGRLGTQTADTLCDWLRAHDLQVAWVLETHVHADHLSAAQHIKGCFPGSRTGIGARVTAVQAHFRERFNAGHKIPADGRQFDCLFEDGDRVPLGELTIEVMHTPGHTGACVTYVVGDAAFVGDTIFMPDYGTARADFPGGDAATLYRSIQRILALPPQTRLFVGHDYGTERRQERRAESSVAEQRAANVHLTQAPGEDAYVALRRCRDAQLATPRLLYPALQYNIRGGALPEAEDNGTHYLKIPVTVAG